MEQYIEFKGSLAGNSDKEFYPLNIELHLQQGKKVIGTFRKTKFDEIELESLRYVASTEELLSGVDTMQMDLVYVFPNPEVINLLPLTFKRIGVIRND